MKDRIRVYDQDGTIHEASENIRTLSAPITITKAELYYKAEGDLVSEWHVVEDLPVIVFAVDDIEPEIFFTPDKANSNGYYSSDVVNVKIKVEDKETYSGLESVEYWITDGIKTSDSVTLYKCDDNEIRNTYETTITVNSTEFNSDSVLVHVKATDRAGIPADSDCPLKINSTEPTAEIEIIPTSKPEARDGYYEAVQARITYTDRASTFDETAALNGLTITAEPKVVISKNAIHVLAYPRTAVIVHWLTCIKHNPVADGG